MSSSCSQPRISGSSCLLENLDACPPAEFEVLSSRHCRSRESTTRSLYGTQGNSSCFNKASCQGLNGWCVGAVVSQEDVEGLPTDHLRV